MISRRAWITTAGAALTATALPRGAFAAPAFSAPSVRGTTLDTTGLESFAAWNEGLRRARPGLDSVFVDLDILDQNIDTIAAIVGPQFAQRTVTKGLPCIGLLSYIMKRNRSPRLMTFSEGVLDACLTGLGDNVDMLQGRPVPVEGVQRLLVRHGRDRLRNVGFLVDTVATAEQYARLGVPLKVAVEIDCGTRRGGARDTGELLAILNVIAHSPMRFAGMMGYDGHVIFAPLTAQIPGAPIVLTSDQAFGDVTNRYAEFVNAAKSAFPHWFGSDRPIVLNSGGSVTLNYYNAGLQSPVNDIAFGIGYLCPSRYAQWLEAFGLVNACYCCSVLTKRIYPAELPFEPGYLPMIGQQNPSFETNYYVNSGGFPASKVYPQELIDSPFVPADPSGELYANQTQFYGPNSVSLDVGDNVFFRPYESSAIAWLGELVAMRGGRVVDVWNTIQEQPPTPRQFG